MGGCRRRAKGREGRGCERGREKDELVEKKLDAVGVVQLSSHVREAWAGLVENDGDLEEKDQEGGGRRKLTWARWHSRAHSR